LFKFKEGAKPKEGGVIKSDITYSITL